MDKDLLSEATNTFLERLPDPRQSPASTLFGEIDIQGKKIKLMAQKIKALGGLTWKIYPVRDNLARFITPTI
jgi:hypothetical protein